MQQSASFSGGAEGEGGTNHQVMEDMTRLTDKQQMANFLTWGKWDLDNSAIEKLVKDEERKERVGTSYIFSDFHKCTCCKMFWLCCKFIKLNVAIVAEGDYWCKSTEMVDSSQEVVSSDGSRSKSEFTTIRLDVYHFGWIYTLSFFFIISILKLFLCHVILFPDCSSAGCRVWSDLEWRYQSFKLHAQFIFYSMFWFRVTRYSSNIKF